MTTIFGEVAADYEQIRPEYPISIVPQILDYAGGTPSLVAEIGAGTGKGTALFAQLGAPLLCVEPDARMAEQLTAKFPDVEVVGSDFDSWTPPAGGVPLLAGAMMWHLLDAETRCAKAHSALAPGGVIALIGRRHANSDPAQELALDHAYATYGNVAGRPEDWIAADLTASGLFTEVTISRHDTANPLLADDYLRLVNTFSTFRKLPADRQKSLLTALREAITQTGGTVHLELRTTLNLGRRNG